MGGSERILAAKRKSVWKIDQIKKEAKRIKKQGYLKKVHSSESKGTLIKKKQRSDVEFKGAEEVFSNDEAAIEEEEKVSVTNGGDHSSAEKKGALRRQQDLSLTLYQKKRLPSSSFIKN